MTSHCTDVLPCKIGTRKGTIEVSNDVITVKSGQTCTQVPLDEVHMVHRNGRVGCVHLKAPSVVVPGTKRPRLQFMCTFPLEQSIDAFAEAIGRYVNLVDFTDAHHYTSSCEGHCLSMENGALCAKSPQTQRVIDFNDVFAVLFQRTRGGMATFDAIICTAADVCFVERLLHADMHTIAAMFSCEGINVIDAGPDPLPLHLVKQELANCPPTRSDVHEAMSVSFDSTVQDAQSDDEIENGDEEWNGSDENMDSDVSSVSEYDTQCSTEDESDSG